MGRYFQIFRDAVKKCDKVLLMLCLVATALGCLIVASATNHMNTLSNVIVQAGGTVLGVLFYLIFSSIDAEFFSEHRRAMVIFNTFLLLLLIPFGIAPGGNRSWLDFPFLPFNIQPAEICKITFILILASVMASHQNKISSVPSVMHMALHLALLAGINLVISGDLGVSLIFVAIFAGMAFSGGVNIMWFLAAIGAVVVGLPILFPFLSDYQQDRILVLFNPSLDAAGTGVLWQTNRALRSLTGGGLTGQGLFNGHHTQQGSLTAQHTDFVFCAVGEEMGYLGCALVLILLALIVFRCIWVGNRSTDFMRKVICYGAASALVFQIVCNIGMCIGVMPVIGLTLPFISYGGSSIVSLYAMLGLVSGVYARPAAASHERYIRPPVPTYR